MHAERCPELGGVYPGRALYGEHLGTSRLAWSPDQDQVQRARWHDPHQIADKDVCVDDIVAVGDRHPYAALPGDVNA